MDPLNELQERLAREATLLDEELQRHRNLGGGTTADSTRGAWLRGKRDGIETAIDFLVDALNPPQSPPPEDPPGVAGFKALIDWLTTPATPTLPGFKLPAWWLTDPIEEPTPPSDLSTVVRVRVERHTSGVNTYLDEGWRLLQVNLNEVAGASAFLLGLDQENAE